MKTNQIYIITAVVIVVLGLFIWSRNDAPEVVDQAGDVSTSTPISGEKTTNTSSTQKPSPSTGKTSTTKPAQIITTDAVPSIPSTSDLENSVFRMISYNGVPVSADLKYPISFKDGILSAELCNSLSGQFILDGSSIKADNIISTRKYCSSPANVMEIEASFVTMLNYGAIIYKSDNKLIISYSKGTVMVFSGF